MSKALKCDRCGDRTGHGLLRRGRDDRGALRGDRPLRVDRRAPRRSRVRLLGGEGAMRLAGKPYGLTKGERRFGIAAGIAMFALAVLAAL